MVNAKFLCNPLELNTPVNMLIAYQSIGIAMYLIYNYKLEFSNEKRVHEYCIYKQLQQTLNGQQVSK